MGFFDFLKPKKKAKEEEIDENAFLLAYLKFQLEELGHTVEFSTEYAAILVNSEIEIATAIMPGDFHPLMLPVMIITIHPTYFPEGIVTYLTGLGDSIEAKTATVGEEYINDIFGTIAESVQDTHETTHTFDTSVNGENVRMQIFASDNVYQGNWDESSKKKSLLSALEEGLKIAPLDQKINSLKVYLSKQENGQFSVECTLNNEQWETGFDLLKKYAATWGKDGGFRGQKQFIMFRRCDEFD